LDRTNQKVVRKNNGTEVSLSRTKTGEVDLMTTATTSALTGDRLAGINAASARGRLPGNPGLREKQPEALAKLSAARRRGHLADLTAGMSSWLPILRRMRPEYPWDAGARTLRPP
ncbi:hypothetical protein BTM36_27485, partial [Herbaspirillum sp. VT-16-41]